MKPVEEVKVLVVEDDPFFLKVLQRRITSEGYQVITAADGREGMKAIVAHEPDLVISDWMMPEVDGLELCQSVKTGLRDAAPYFILLTAKGEISDKLLALETGADDYLTKPCDQGELMARVRAGVRIVTLTQDLRRTVADLKVANAALAASAAASPVPGGLTLCRSCHRVCGPDGAWEEIRAFLASRIGSAPAQATCPDCAAARELNEPPSEQAA
jgi:sigma-B regulation protein RsbU (phosphoserine phosphatase)